MQAGSHSYGVGPSKQLRCDGLGMGVKGAEILRGRMAWGSGHGDPGLKGVGLVVAADLLQEYGIILHKVDHLRGWGLRWPCRQTTMLIH